MSRSVAPEFVPLARKTRVFVPFWTPPLVLDVKTTVLESPVDPVAFPATRQLEAPFPEA